MKIHFEHTDNLQRRIELFMGSPRDYRHVRRIVRPRHRSPREIVGRIIGHPRSR